FQRTHLQIPEEVDSLVQAVYGDTKLDALDRYREEVDLAKHKAENDRVIRQRTANMYKTASPHERAERAWNLTGADDDDLTSRALRIPTRLGDRAVSVIPIV